MEKKIVDLVIKYALENKKIDDDFIQQVVFDVVDKKNLKNYVASIELTTDLSSTDTSVTVASYVYRSAKIQIDTEAMSFIIREFYERFSDYFTNFEQRVCSYLKIAQSLLHELEHALQLKIYDNIYDSTIEARVIRSAFSPRENITSYEFIEAVKSGKISVNDALKLAEETLRLYKAYYDVDPTERMAQINSYTSILSGLTEHRDVLQNPFDFYNTELHKEFLKGYDYGLDICPTQIFLEGTNQTGCYEQLGFYDQDPQKTLKNVSDKYDFYKRVELGFPISKDEYEHLNGKMRSLNKFGL